MKPTLSAFVSGTLFGSGLAVAQMTNPAKVIGFLDVAGSWDPSLAFVMGAALLVSAIAYRVHNTRSAPQAPGAEIDGRLITGASLFGIGWGLAGFCPGPAIAALATGSDQVTLFVASMLAGMALFHFSLEVRVETSNPKSSRSPA